MTLFSKLIFCFFWHNSPMRARAYKLIAVFMKRIIVHIIYRAMTHILLHLIITTMTVPSYGSFRYNSSTRFFLQDLIPNSFSLFNIFSYLIFHHVQDLSNGPFPPTVISIAFMGILIFPYVLYNILTITTKKKKNRFSRIFKFNNFTVFI